MSFCRWGSESDVYAYEHVHNYFAVHVASYNVIEMSDDLEKIKTEPIGLKYDGYNYKEKTIEDLLGRLLFLKKEGYKVPDYALETIKQEIEE